MKHNFNKAKMHHFVPCSYLARFAGDNGFLHVYDRHTQIFRRQRPKQVMRINSYYRQEWAPEGVDPNILETSLGESLESEAKGILDRLTETPSQLTDEDIGNLLVYMEMQRIRVPRQAATAKGLLHTTLLRMEPPTVTKSIVFGEARFRIKDSFRFDYMRMMIGKLSPWFEKMHWEVFAAGDGASFITTDSPVSFYNPSIMPPAEAGIGLAGTMILFPLSSRHILIMRHPEYSNGSVPSPLHLLPTPTHEDGQLSIAHGKTWNREEVDNTNWLMVQLSSQIIVADSSTVLTKCTTDNRV